MTDWFAVENEEEIASPALLLFRERIEENFQLMLKMAGGPQRLRPHVKTHKLEPLVRRQLELGIAKFKCATMAEAEMSARAGAADVLLALPAVGPEASRLLDLARRFPQTAFSTLADDSDAVHHLGSLADAAAMTLGVWLDIDCGMRRTGVPPGPLAIDLYRQLSQSHGLRACGLHVYDGHIVESDIAARRAHCEAAFAPVLELRHELDARGFAVPALVAGGSPTFAFHVEGTDRECSPGTTVLWDFGYSDKFPDLPYQPAALLLTRVISRPSATRLCLDLGHKAVASENPHPRVRLLEIPDAEFVMHSEEHLVLETPRAAQFRVGDVLHGIPRHVCPTVALHGEAILVENNRATHRWPISARNRRITV